MLIIQFLDESLFDDNSEFVVICSPSGDVVAGDILTEVDNLVEYLYINNVSNIDVNNFKESLENNKSNVIMFNMNNDEYLLSMCFDEDHLGDLRVIELYNIDKMLKNDINISEKTMFIIFISLAIIVVLIVLIINKISNKKPNK